MILMAKTWLVNIIMETVQIYEIPKVLNSGSENQY